jgi:hypothetical protein
MKKLFLIAATLAAFASPAFATGVKYPADATPAAIAANEAVRKEIKRVPAVSIANQTDISPNYMKWFDPRYNTTMLDFGGGGGGGGGE